MDFTKLKLFAFFKIEKMIFSFAHEHKQTKHPYLDTNLTFPTKELPIMLLLVLFYYFYPTKLI